MQAEAISTLLIQVKQLNHFDKIQLAKNLQEMIEEEQVSQSRKNGTSPQKLALQKLRGIWADRSDAPTTEELRSMWDRTTYLDEPHVD